MFKTIVLCAALISLANTGFASTGASKLCDNAAIKAAELYNIAPEIMLALTRTETGRHTNGALNPWPWAINDRGQSQWHNSPTDAIHSAKRLIKQGINQFDVGCFQINFKWHHNGFATVDEMFDPNKNAQYAAMFLRQLYEQTLDWHSAVGMYHSRNPKFSQPYQKRFSKILKVLNTRTNHIELAQAKPINHVLQNHKPVLGSLVPIDHLAQTQTLFDRDLQ